jgi:signal transduction histidine kinase
MHPEKTEIIIVAIAGTIVILLLIAFLLGLFFIFKQRILRHSKEKATLHAIYAQEILQTQIEIQNITLQHISQELHDNIGQLLSVARINLNVAETSHNLAEAQMYINQTNELIGQLIDDVRALTKSFDGDFVKDFGLCENISQEMKRISKTNQYATEFYIEGFPVPLGYDIEIVIFRIFQELLNNCIKHAKATKIQVNLEFSSNRFRLSLTDNGIGFDPANMEAPLEHSGAGLRNIQRRVDLVLGRLSILSRVRGGTKIELYVPIGEANI